MLSYNFPYFTAIAYIFSHSLGYCYHCLKKHVGYPFMIIFLCCNFFFFLSIANMTLYEITVFKEKCILFSGNQFCFVFLVRGKGDVELLAEIIPLTMQSLFCFWDSKLLLECNQRALLSLVLWFQPWISFQHGSMIE